MTHAGRTLCFCMCACVHTCVCVCECVCACVRACMCVCMTAGDLRLGLAWHVKCATQLMRCDKLFAGSPVLACVPDTESSERMVMQPSLHGALPRDPFTQLGCGCRTSCLRVTCCVRLQASNAQEKKKSFLKCYLKGRSLQVLQGYLKGRSLQTLKCYLKGGSLWVLKGYLKDGSVQVLKCYIKDRPLRVPCCLMSTTCTWTWTGSNFCLR